MVCVFQIHFGIGFKFGQYNFIIIILSTLPIRSLSVLMKFQNVSYNTHAKLHAKCSNTFARHCTYNPCNSNISLLNIFTRQSTVQFHFQHVFAIRESGPFLLFAMTLPATLQKSFYRLIEWRVANILFES